jgi:hypothetical protein
MATQTNAIQVQSYLKDAEYPMERDALVILAEGNDAPEEVLDMIEALPDVEFESATDVQEALNGHGKEIPSREQQGSQRQGGQRPSRISASRRREMEERKRQLKEETGKLTEPGKTVTGAPDHRLKGQETEAIRSARHMEHGYDGRGQITNPEMDARLAENRARPEGEEAQAEPPRSHEKEGGSHRRQTWKQFSKR